MDFSDKILEQILSNFTEKDLKVFLTIKKFRDVILKSRKLMRKLTLYLLYSGWRSKLDFIEKYGENVINIEFRHVKIVSFEDIKSVLKCTPNIEKLIIYPNVHNEEVMENSKNLGDFSDRPIFAHLRVLEVTLSYYLARQIFQYLWNCDQITEFCLGHYGGEMYKLILDFICKQKNLRILDIQLSSPFLNVSVSPSIFQGIQFRLQKMIVNFDLEYNKLLEEFFTTQTEVEELHLNCSKIDQKSFQHILRSMRKLKKFNCGFVIIDESEIMYLLDQNIVAESVEELVLINISIFREPFVLEKFLGMFPNLTSINFDNLKNLHFGILGKLKKLTAITTKTLEIVTLYDVEMPCLKSLEVFQLQFGRSHEYCENFAKCNPNLEKFLIYGFKNCRAANSTKSDLSTLLRVLEHFKRLKEFYVRCTFYERTVNEFEDELEHPFVVLISIKIFESQRTKLSFSSYFVQNFVEDYEQLQVRYPNSEIDIV